MIIALDLETTGLDNRKDKIIEIALVAFDEQTFEVKDTFTTLINPGIHIPEMNSNITGIFDDDVKDAPIFDINMVQKIKNFIGNSPILGHNTYFDRDFLIKNGVDISENVVLDTFVLANFLMLDEKSLNLGSLCESLQIDIGEAHRALDDTMGTLRVFEKLVEKFHSLSDTKKQLLFHVFSRSYHISFPYYIEYFQLKQYKKLSQDEMIETLLKVVKKYFPKNFDVIEKKTLPNDIEEVFQRLPNFEVRANQHTMAQKVHESFFDNKKTIIEAPTGVGKTFAYSIPALMYALKHEEQVVISTNTKALQDQIFYKDLAYLEKNLGVDFTYAKLKGRKNYLSIFQFFETYFASVTLDLDETSLYAKLILWMFQTEFGELDELNFYPKEYQILNSLHADHFVVLTDENEYKYYEYLFKAKTHAQYANLVIINHSILLQDLKSKNGTFAQMKNLVIDEAHNLEDTTTQALKKSFTVVDFIQNSQKTLAVLLKNSKTLENLETLFSDTTNLLSLLFDIFGDYAVTKNTYANEVFEVGIETDFFAQDTNITELFQKIETNFVDIFNRLSLLDDKTYMLVKSYVAFFEEMLEIVAMCCKLESRTNYIPVYSQHPVSGSSLSFTLLHPGKFLKTQLYDTLDSLVITSATLQINNSFDYFKKILCFDDDFDFLVLESDFDYKKQSLLFIPNDLGSARYNNPVMLQFLEDFITIVKGKTLVLMTSFSSIRDAYLFLNTQLKKLGVTVLAQSIGGSKHKIVNHYKKFYEKSVILGTDSFWEGVDFPGEELKYLVIHKFPFDVPTDPIFKARSKLFKDSFLEYSVPKAIIKTKQGFGRLIRTKNDSGIVILLDERVHQTGWGELMLQAFPKEGNIKIGNSKQFLDTLSKKSLE